MRSKFHINWYFCLLFFSYLGAGLLAQGDHKESLIDRIYANEDLFLTDIDSAIKNAKVLMREAVEKEDINAEFKLLDQYCWYYNRVGDVENLVKTANYLKEKAASNKNIRSQAISHIYLSQAFVHNELFEKAKEEYNTAIAISKKLDQGDQNMIRFRANAHILTANVYFQQQKSKEAIYYLFLASKEIEKFDDPEMKRFWNYINFRNLGESYVEYNLDSAEYFANKSILLKNNSAEDDGNMSINYTTLGKIHYKRKNYEKAESYFLKAEELIPKGTHFESIEAIYSGLSEIYSIQGDVSRKQLYEQKLKNAQYELEKSKNKSLHTIIEKNMLQDRRLTIYVAAGALIIIVVLLVVVFYFRRKNKLLKQQEKISQQYLEEEKEQSEPNEKDYDYTKLVDMVKKNDSAFMVAFLEIFPEFPENLRRINPKIVQTELEFCALLKLNLPTNEIAIYKNIEKRTVQVKKYRIRKKLNIPDDMDIYMWFSQL